MATLASFKIPKVQNEPNKHYEKGSADRKSLEIAVAKLKSRLPLKVPVVVDGAHLSGSQTKTQNDPAAHKTVVAEYGYASHADVQSAIRSALAAKPAWEALPFADRAAVFLKAADLIAGKYRYDIMAATMLGQGKNAWQAEIDAAAELTDFLRFNVKYAEQLYREQQPEENSAGVWNRVELRPLEGFVYAISPFNFTAIGGNLVAAPALMGNVVLWKPSDYAIASNWLVYQILLEAGLPKNVVQWIPGDPVAVTETVLASKDFAALHYTGSTAVFRSLYGKIATGVADGKYKGYPRLVGETGGKNFHLIHKTADVPNAVAHTARGAFEYSGQKCSATSRAYVPKSLWPEFQEQLITATNSLKVGAPTSAENFIGPLIHQGAYDRVAGAIESAKKDPELTLIAGGETDASTGYFVHPTVFVTKNPNHWILSRELFGPVLGIYVYDDSSSTATTEAAQDKSFLEICDVVDRTSEYGLTGSIFAADRAAINVAVEKLRHSAGNFYINCKSTGAVVGQQPFGGARASGTNDKAGSSNILLRFVSNRAIKEDFVGSTDVEYPSNFV